MANTRFYQKGSPAHWAQHYTSRLSLALVPIPAGMKGPRATGWNDPQNAITDPNHAVRVWTDDASQNMGVLHSASHTATLDLDEPEWAEQALAAVGVCLADLLTCPVRIKGKNGEKPFYRLPEGCEFDRRSLAWPHPTDLMPNGRPRLVTVFELRAGAVQDVLPPSIHPDTGRPYEWVGTPPRTRNEIPELPAQLRDLWENWDHYLDFLRDACPWATERPRTPQQTHTPRETPYDGPQRPGDAFREQVGIREVLERNGYRRRGERYLPPDSKTRVAGVRVLRGEDDRERAFSDHGSCPLNNGHAHDSFSALILLEHAGNVTAAVKAVVAELGMARERPSVTEEAAPPITAEQVQSNWEAAQTVLIHKGCAVLDAAQGNARQKNSLFDLWAALTEIAITNIWERGGHFYINLGGILNLKNQGITGRPADIAARLRYLGTLGFHHGVTKLDPADPSSQLLIRVPASPHDLPFMAFTLEESKRLIVQVPTWRQRSGETWRKVTTTSKARPKGSCYLSQRFAGVAQTVVWILAVPDATTGDIAELRGKSVYTIQAHVRALKAAGLVSVVKRRIYVTASWGEIREILRIERENDPSFRASVEAAICRTITYCKSGIFAHPPLPQPIQRRRRSMLKVAQLRLERLRAGEPVSEVMKCVA